MTRQIQSDPQAKPLPLAAVLARTVLFFALFVGTVYTAIYAVSRVAGVPHSGIRLIDLGEPAHPTPPEDLRF